MNIKVVVLDKPRDLGCLDLPLIVGEVVYRNIHSYNIVTTEDAEYLVIKLKDGSTATFCNSHVDVYEVKEEMV